MVDIPFSTTVLILKKILMKLRLMNDPVLRKATSPVVQDDLETIKSLVPQMVEIMNAEEGVGLAANQVGVSKRFFIMKDGEEVRILLNPEIIELGPLTPFTEGCLSIPGTSAETQRAQHVKLKYKDENFNDIETEYNGLTAVAIQHEVDHLDGKLYIDHLQPMRRMMTVNKYLKFIKMKGRG